MKRKRILWSGLGLLILVLAGWGLMPKPVLVAAVPVEKGDISRQVKDSGIVQPVKSWDVYTDQSGRILKIPVAVGQKVVKDQLMMLLSDTDLSLTITQTAAELSQAEAQAAGAKAAFRKLESALAQSQTDLTRAKDLLSAGAITQSEYEAAALQVQTDEKELKEADAVIDAAGSSAAGLRSSLKELKEKEGRLTVKSPGSGIILEMPVKEGEVILPGSLLLTLSGSDALEVKADILSDDLADVQIGQSVEVKAAVMGEKMLRGKVTKIYPQAEEKQSALGITQRRVPVIISLNNTGNLKPGYEVEAAINTRSKKGALVLPRESVRTALDGSKEVFLLAGGRVKIQPVTTGLDDENRIEILSGLQKGDLVARDGGADLKAGQKIQAEK